MLTKHLLGASLLVAGTAIGAGMLALPIVTAQGGFFPALFIFVLSWLFMTATGLLLLEIALKLPPGANLISMAEHYLGKGGKIFAWGLYLFLFYCLSTAYIAGGGSLVADWLRLYPKVGLILFLALLSPFVMRGARAVDRINQLFMVGLIGSYCAFVIWGIPHVQPSFLKGENWAVSFLALPVIFTSFSYQGVIPSLVSYLNRDAKALRLAIVGGTTLAFLIYFFWELLILGIVPLEGAGGLLEAKRLNQSAVTPLRMQLGSSWVVFIGQAFAFFAITTSFLGVTLGLLDFLSDGLKWPKKGSYHFFLAGLTFLPPLAVALINPNIFITALGFAGGIGCALLLGLLPILMVWVSRYRKKEESSLFQIGGGKAVLLLLVLFVVLELFMEVYEHLL